MFLNTLVQDSNLVDVGWVLSKSNATQFTHYQRENHARLDRAYISSGLVPMCQNYAVKHVSFSDHSLVLFTLGAKQN